MTRPESVTDHETRSHDVRPALVQYACIYGIVLGIVLIAAAFSLLIGGATLSAVNAGPLIALVLMLPLFAIPFTFGAVAIWAGTQAMKGAAWARWTILTIFAVVAVAGLLFFRKLMPGLLAFGSLVALIILLTPQATRWFKASTPPKSKAT